MVYIGKLSKPLPQVIYTFKYSGNMMRDQVLVNNAIFKVENQKTSDHSYPCIHLVLHVSWQWRVYIWVLCECV